MPNVTATPPRRVPEDGVDLPEEEEEELSDREGEPERLESTLSERE